MATNPQFLTNVSKCVRVNNIEFVDFPREFWILKKKEAQTIILLLRFLLSLYSPESLFRSKSIFSIVNNFADLHVLLHIFIL